MFYKLYPVPVPELYLYWFILLYCLDCRIWGFVYTKIVVNLKFNQFLKLYYITVNRINRLTSQSTFFNINIIYDTVLLYFFNRYKQRMLFLIVVTH